MKNCEFVWKSVEKFFLVVMIVEVVGVASVFMSVDEAIESW